MESSLYMPFAGDKTSLMLVMKYFNSPYPVLQKNIHLK